MGPQIMNPNCPDDHLTASMATVGDDQARGLEMVDRLLTDYPMDSRLHFLRGSFLAGLQRYPEAHLSMANALALAPDYDIARFQLGLLELTSGEAGAAQATWAPLLRLDARHPLRLFATGLNHLIRDEFEPAVSQLREGIGLNAQNLPLNADMNRIIDAILARVEASQLGDEPVSPTHLLMQQYSLKKTKH